jgi:hypothetical protein
VTDNDSVISDHTLCVLTCHWHQIIKDCEKSGNGFGQRDSSDDSFGQFDVAMSMGDERSSFVKVHTGQRFHHLYFWHMADLMGVLKNVLNVLSPEVSGDTDNIPGDTASTQRSRRGRADEERDEDRVAKKLFREGVQSSLIMIGSGLRDANNIQAIVTTRAAIHREEEKIQSFTVKCLTCPPEEKRIYDGLIVQLTGRVAGYEEELAVLVKARDGN